MMEILGDELVDGVWVSDEYSAIKLDRVAAAPRSEDSSESCAPFKLVLAAARLAQ